MNAVVGRDHLFLLTLDTLRYDVAASALAAGRTPNLAALLPDGEWEERHTPGSFTFAAHAAFFAGFLPTPIDGDDLTRPLALSFPGSETIGGTTCVLDAPDLVSGLRSRGYHSACIGGVGFFNPASPLGGVLPALFDESHWAPEMGVTDARSFEHQVRCAAGVLRAHRDELTFLFVNVSALHQPNCIFSDGATEDSPATQEDALAYVDAQLPALLTALRAHGSWYGFICSDHGTAYGEDRRVGHRFAHEVVWTVPYAEVVIEADA